MKNTRRMLIITIIASVFLLSFLMGRATALRDKDEKGSQNKIYTGTVNIPKETEEETAPAAAGAKVKKEEKEEVTKEQKKEKIKKEPPSRMLFPCSGEVLKGYSETAVYSQTMGDWRAHTGIDYALDAGSDVKSVWDGEVIRIYKDKLWGHTIEILHDGNIKSVYKNLESKKNVKEGEIVTKGQVIGKVGKSAAVESREEEHLHFELWQGGIVINPESYVY